MSTWPTREEIAIASYEANERKRAELEEGSLEPWVPWSGQTSSRERQVAYTVADAILALFEPNRLRVLPPRMPHIPPPDPVERDLADLDTLLPLAQALVAWIDWSGEEPCLSPCQHKTCAILLNVRALPPDLAARLREGAP